MTGGQAKTIVLGLFDDAIQDALSSTALRTGCAYSLDLCGNGVPLKIDLKPKLMLHQLRKIRARYNRLKKADYAPCMQTTRTSVNVDAKRSNDDTRKA